MKKELTLFACGVDWQHEVGEAAGGTIFYGSQRDLKKHKPCWKSCGIVSVRVRVGRWTVKQDIMKGMRKVK